MHSGFSGAGSNIWTEERNHRSVRGDDSHMEASFERQRWVRDDIQNLIAQGSLRVTVEGLSDEEFGELEEEEVEDVEEEMYEKEEGEEEVEEEEIEEDEEGEEESVVTERALDKESECDSNFKRNFHVERFKEDRTEGGWEVADEVNEECMRRMILDPDTKFSRQGASAGYHLKLLKETGLRGTCSDAAQPPSSSLSSGHERIIQRCTSLPSSALNGSGCSTANLSMAPHDGHGISITGSTLPHPPIPRERSGHQLLKSRSASAKVQNFRAAIPPEQFVPQELRSIRERSGQCSGYGCQPVGPMAATRPRWSCPSNVAPPPLSSLTSHGRAFLRTRSNSEVEKRGYRNGGEWTGGVALKHGAEALAHTVMNASLKDSFPRRRAARYHAPVLQVAAGMTNSGPGRIVVDPNSDFEYEGLDASQERRPDPYSSIDNLIPEAEQIIYICEALEDLYPSETVPPLSLDRTRSMPETNILSGLPFLEIPGMSSDSPRELPRAISSNPVMPNGMASRPSHGPPATNPLQQGGRLDKRHSQSSVGTSIAKKAFHHEQLRIIVPGSESNAPMPVRSERPHSPKKLVPAHTSAQRMQAARNAVKASSVGRPTYPAGVSMRAGIAPAPRRVPSSSHHYEQ